ncbi:MAG: hypothetical protein ACRDGA_00150, partial [Bacteroidota bacterium]
TAREKRTPTQLLLTGVSEEFRPGGISNIEQFKTRPGRIIAGDNPLARAITRSNEFIDEMSRIAVYRRKVKRAGDIGDLDLDDIERRVANGERIPPEIQAQRQTALQEARRTMVDYGRKTPFERRFIRAVFPFYSWQKGIVRLALTMPLDHPLRMEILGQISNQFGGYSQEERETLPEFLIPSLKVGVKLGPLEIERISTRGMNPFADVPSLLDPREIADRMNPFLQAAVQFAGRGVAPFRKFSPIETDPTGLATAGVPIDELVGEVATSLIPGARLIAPHVPAVQQLPGVRPSRGLDVGFLQELGLNIRSLEEIEKAQERVQASRQDIAATRRRLLGQTQPQGGGPSGFSLGGMQGGLLFRQSRTPIFGR